MAESESLGLVRAAGVASVVAAEQAAHSQAWSVGRLALGVCKFVRTLLRPGTAAKQLAQVLVTGFPTLKALPQPISASLAAFPCSADEFRAMATALVARHSFTAAQAARVDLSSLITHDVARSLATALLPGLDTTDRSTGMLVRHALFGCVRLPAFRAAVREGEMLQRLQERTEADLKHLAAMDGTQFYKMGGLSRKSPIDELVGACAVCSTPPELKAWFERLTRRHGDVMKQRCAVSQAVAACAGADSCDRWRKRWPFRFARSRRGATCQATRTPCGPD